MTVEEMARVAVAQLRNPMLSEQEVDPATVIAAAIRPTLDAKDAEIKRLQGIVYEKDSIISTLRRNAEPRNY